MILSRRNALVSVGALTMVTASGLAWSQLSKRSPSVINTLDSPAGAAIKGYDPVAYFTVGKPTRGTPAHAVTYSGATWLFASAENKTLFEKDPQKYVPAYGGYCAYGVSQGYLVKIEPDAWSIRNGRLYLNYDKSVQKQWEQKTNQYIATADKNWPSLSQRTN